MDVEIERHRSFLSDICSLVVALELNGRAVVGENGDFLAFEGIFSAHAHGRSENLGAPLNEGDLGRLIEGHFETKLLALCFMAGDEMGRY